jgi:hypothetical protein
MNRLAQCARQIANSSVSCLGVLIGLGLSPPVAQAQVPIAQLREEVRYGSVWDEDSMLTWVLGVSLYGDSLLLVLDGRDEAIKVFDWSGEPIGQIGRPGSGPGEFSAPGSVGVRNDTVFVRNAGTRSLNLLTISGDELARFRLPPIPVAGGVRSVVGPSGMFPDGTFLGLASASYPYLYREHTEYSIPILKLGRTGEILDTLGFRREFKGRKFDLPGGVAQAYFLPPETPGDDSDFSTVLGIIAVAEGFPEGHDNQYRITAIRHTGDTIFSRLYPFQPQRYTSEQRTALALAFGPMAERSRRLREALEEAYAGRPYIPPVSRIRIDCNGRLWVGREWVPGEPVMWEVLSAMGEPQFRVEAPAGVGISLASGDHLWTVERDELDVWYVVRYRILVPD